MRLECLKITDEKLLCDEISIESVRNELLRVINEKYTFNILLYSLILNIYEFCNLLNAINKGDGKKCNSKLSISYSWKFFSNSE